MAEIDESKQLGRVPAFLRAEKRGSRMRCATLLVAILTDANRVQPDCNNQTQMAHGDESSLTTDETAQ